VKVMGDSDAGSHRHTACYPHEVKRPRAEYVMILSTTCSGRLAWKKWIVLIFIQNVTLDRPFQQNGRFSPGPVRRAVR
jgi:hypothetical protein